jgi:hypothetical protein
MIGLGLQLGQLQAEVETEAPLSTQESKGWCFLFLIVMKLSCSSFMPFQVYWPDVAGGTR